MYEKRKSGNGHFSASTSVNQIRKKFRISIPCVGAGPLTFADRDLFFDAPRFRETCFCVGLILCQYLSPKSRHKVFSSFLSHTELNDKHLLLSRPMYSTLDDPSSATAATRRGDWNRSAMPPFAAVQAPRGAKLFT